MGRAGGRRRRDGDGRHAAARGDARVGQGEQGRAQGPDHHADRHRLPLRERRTASRARPLCVPPPVQDVRGRAVALRQRRSRHRPREHRGPVCRHRVRGRHARSGAGHQRAQRPAEEADPRRLRPLDQADQPRRLRAHHPLRVRLRARPRAQARVVRDEGEHHEVHRRALPRRVPRRREGLPGDRAVGEPRRRDLHGSRAAPRGVRRAGAAEPVRRHRERPHSRPRRRPRRRAGRQHRPGLGGLRGDARLGAEVQGPEQGQPDGDDPLREAHARASRRGRRSAAARSRSRRSDRRGRRA